MRDTTGAEAGPGEIPSSPYVVLTLKDTVSFILIIPTPCLLAVDGSRVIGCVCVEKPVLLIPNALALHGNCFLKLLFRKR